MNRAAEFGIKRVYASRSYHGDAVVQTSVCWNGTQRCVPLMGGKVTTSAFNGLDPSRPIYLVHKAMGKGPLPTPVYIKGRSEEHTSELQSLMRISYAVFCLKKKNKYTDTR